MDYEPTKASKRLSTASKARRKALGLSQKELALLAGVGVAFIYDLENGKPTLRLDKVLAVLAVLGLRFAVEDGHDGIADATAGDKGPKS